MIVDFFKFISFYTVDTTLRRLKLQTSLFAPFELKKKDLKMSSAATQFSQFLKTILYVNYMHVTLDDVTLRVTLHSFCAWYMYYTVLAYGPQSCCILREIYRDPKDSYRGFVP